jgi:thiosulfate/3-mercaptopyruvate sulfurtransferase
MTTPLVSPWWLSENLAEVRILDARFKLSDPELGLRAYRAGHIPGALFVDLERDLSAPVRADRVGGRHPLPSTEVLARVFSRLGVSNSDHVIAYDDPSEGQGFYAPHLWWLLRYLGHDRVSVLDGGLPAWIASGGALSTDTPAPSPTEFAVHPRPGMLASVEEVASRAAGTILIDSRAPDRFRGETEPVDWKGGHIPGAINLPWSGGIESGQWKPATDQRQRLAEVSAAPDAIVYCGSGVSACGNLLAMEIAGVKHVRLYVGSWSDWISDPDRPIATGG